MDYILDKGWRVSGWWPNQAEWAQNGRLTNFAAVGEIDAVVPGGIQADLLRAGIIKDWNLGTRSVECEWVEHREWLYRVEFDRPEGFEAFERQFLCFDGLDYSGIILLNGEKLAEFKGMHLPYRFDVTGKLQDANTLQVLFRQPPEVDGQFGYTSRVREMKSRFNYIWDWTPRIVPTGFFDRVYLRTTGAVTLDAAHVRTDAGGKLTALLTFDARRKGKYAAELVLSYKGGEVARLREEFPLAEGSAGRELTLSVSNPKLWSPCGRGEQNFYELTATVFDGGDVSDTLTRRVGFRDVAFVKPQKPKPDTLPYLAVVNGKPLFLRGVNWVPMSPLYGLSSEADYRRELGLFKEMNANLIRVWGGALLESETFYNVCDELGLMVWQEFPQSSSGIDNAPPDDDGYIANLVAIAQSFIERRGHHPSQVVWCAGNELYRADNAGPVHPNHKNIAALRRLVLELDPGKLFLPGSPSGGEHGHGVDGEGNVAAYDSHGPWDYLDEAHYPHFNRDAVHFNSEIGSPSTARYANLVRFSDGHSLYPLDETNPYWQHRGSWWHRAAQIERLLGPLPEGEEAVVPYTQALRFMHAESLRYSCDATRRRFAEAAGYIVWMGNEPFPNAANTSLIEYDGGAKPAYFEMRQSFAPFFASARYEKLLHQSGEAITVELFAGGDGPFDETVAASWHRADGTCLKRAELACRGDNETVSLGDFTLGAGEVGLLVLRLAYRGEERHYFFTRALERPFSGLASLEKTGLSVREEGGRVLVRNTGSVAAVGVFLLYESDRPANLFPNYFTLFPGEERSASRAGDGSGVLTVEGFNVDAFTV